MATTRREFMEGTAAVGLAVALGAGGRAAAAALTGGFVVARPADELCGELGSPHYLSSEGPDDLGGDDAYERLREHVVHFAMSPEHRDRYLLGL